MRLSMFNVLRILFKHPRGLRRRFYYESERTAWCAAFNLAKQSLRG